MMNVRQTLTCLLTVLVMITTASPALARISEPDVIFYGTVTDPQSGQITAGEVTLKLNNQTVPLLAYQLGLDPTVGDDYLLKVPMQLVNQNSPKDPDTAIKGDMAIFYVDGVAAGQIKIPASGSVVRFNLSTDFGRDDDGDGLPDHWESAMLGGTDRDGTGDLNGNGISDLDEYLQGLDPAACVWQQSEAPDIVDACVFHELVLASCLADAGGDFLHNNIQLVSGGYPGHFNYTALSGEDYNLTLAGGFAGQYFDSILNVASSSGSAPFLDSQTFAGGVACGEQMTNPSVTILSGDVDGDGVGDGRVVTLDGDSNTVTAMLSLENLQLSDGVAPQGENGGGLSAAIFNGGLQLEAVTVVGNSAVQGGGVAVASSGFGSFSVINSMIVNNAATDHGGGIHLQLQDGHAALLSSTVAGNSSGNLSGGVTLIYSGSLASASITNTIISNNNAVLAADDLFVNGSDYPATLTLKSSLFDYGEVFFAGTAPVFDPSNINGGTAGFVDGTAGNYHLRSDSALLGLGDDTVAGLPAIDFDGDARIINGLDLGADEYDAATSDSDGDGLVDQVEIDNGLDPLDGRDAQQDPDGDTLTNAQEVEKGTNPFLADTDGDGYRDDVDDQPNTSTNTSPTISTLPNKYILEDSDPLQLSFLIADSESLTAELAVTAQSSNPSLLPLRNLLIQGVESLRTVMLFPAPDQFGSATITLTVSDGQLQASSEFTIYVDPLDDVPRISGQPDAPAVQGQPFSFMPTVLEVDGDTLTFSIINQPVWADFDTTSGEISGTPGDLDLGTTTGIVISVTDDVSANPVSLAAFDLAVIHVNEVPVITAASEIHTSAGIGVTVSLADLFVTDSDNNYPDDFTLAIQDGANYTVAGATVTPYAGFVGTLVVPVTVSDGTNSSPVFALSILSDYVASGQNCTTISSLPYVISKQGQYCFEADQSISAAFGYAIDVLVNNVTIDFKNLSLSNIGVGTENDMIGVHAQGLKNIVIKNGNFAGFYAGVFIDGGSGHQVINNNFNGNYKHAIYLVGQGRIENNTIVNVGGRANSDSSAIYINSKASIIRNNIISAFVAPVGYAANGIYLADTVQNLIHNNIITGSAASAAPTIGVYLDNDSLSSDIVKGNIMSSLNYGIYLQYSANVVLRKNTIANSTNSVAVAAGSSGNDAGGNYPTP